MSRRSGLPCCAKASSTVAITAAIEGEPASHHTLSEIAQLGGAEAPLLHVQAHDRLLVVIGDGAMARTQA